MLIVETDIGRDPDDFFTIAYLLSAGIKINAITITPGDPDQIAVARFFNHYFGLNIPIGIPNMDRNKRSSGGVHYKILEQYKLPKESKADGIGSEIIKSVHKPNTEILILGPCTNIGNWLNEQNNIVNKATMQGGFLPNNNPKFAGMDQCGTFNLNGDHRASHTFLSANILHRQMCGKNVCHFVMLDEDKTKMFSGLLGKLARWYTHNNKTKAMHDLVAAICHLRPDIGTWVMGKTVARPAGRWTTDLTIMEDYILESLDHDKFWEIASNAAS